MPEPITFLLTDIEGSTARWESDPEEMRGALAAHDARLRAAVADAGGDLFKHTGDGAMAAFASPRAAIQAAVAAQRQLQLPVRMGICTGEVERRDNDYFGPALNRAARIMAAGHGGQVLLAGSTAALVDGVALLDLGEHRLRGLAQRQRLFQVLAEGLRETFPPLATLGSSAGNLPTPTSPLLGRNDEVSAIATLMAQAKLVTLTGVGGVGKTRLMLEAATAAAHRHADGVWLCELAAVGDARDVVHAIAAVLGVTPQPDKGLLGSLVEVLGSRNLLLVLDNCEQVVEAVAEIVREILARCPRVSVLTSSREALSADGERLHQVAPLAASPAVALFVERARAVSPGFELSRDPTSVEDICRRLEGIPLAIELAAARVRAMSPRQIRDRLDERFRLLGGVRRATSRHQTLAQAVQWSYDLLSGAERLALARLAAFAGGFTLEAAESVCAAGGIEPADVLDLVDSLLRKSLLTIEESGDVVRYGMLETIRQFAAERGAEELAAAQARHAAYFATESDRRFAQWLSPQQIEAYRWLDQDMDNLRVAFRWALEHREIDPAARIASNVGDMARFILREEAANWAAEVVELARAARHPRLIVLLTWAASSAWEFQRNEEAKRFGHEALALLDDAAFEPFGWAYSDLAQVAIMDGDAAAAARFARAGAVHPLDANDRFCTAVLPGFLVRAGLSEEARRAAEAALASTAACGIPSSMSAAHWSYGLAFADTDVEKAVASWQAGLTIARRSGNRFWEIAIAIEIATHQARAGNAQEALESFRDLLAVTGGLHDSFFASAGLIALILLFDRLGRSPAVATLHGALPSSVDRGASAGALDAAAARSRAVLGDALFGEATRKGTALSSAEASLFARAEMERALGEVAQGSSRN